MSQPINEFMTSCPHTIGHDIAVSVARDMMTQHSCHHLPVLDGGNLVGLVSARDLRLAHAVSSGEETSVELLMTDEPVVVDRDEAVNVVIRCMLEKQVGSVIIAAKKGHPWGIFTTTDALKLLAETLS